MSDRLVPRQFTLVCGTVVLLHLLFLWAMHSGIGRKLQQVAPRVVMAAMIMLESPAAPPPVTPVAPLPPPPKAAKPPQTTAAATPALTSPISEPRPLAATPAAALAPSVAVATAPVTTPLAAPAPAPAPEVRVVATLQASGTCQKLEYPTLSSRRQEEGVVKLTFLIGVDGRVLESQIEQSSGYPRLDEAARAGLSKCQFKPGTLDGKPVASWAKLNYRWRLD